MASRKERVAFAPGTERRGATRSLLLVALLAAPLSSMRARSDEPTLVTPPSRRVEIDLGIEFPEAEIARESDPIASFIARQHAEIFAQMVAEHFPVDVSPDGRFLAYLTSNGVYIWDASTNESRQIASFGDGDPISAFATDLLRIDPTGSKLAISTLGAVLAIDLDTGRKVLELPIPSDECVNLRFDHQGKRLCRVIRKHAWFGFIPGRKRSAGSRIEIHDLDTGEQSFRWRRKALIDDVAPAPRDGLDQWAVLDGADRGLVDIVRVKSGPQSAIEVTKRIPARAMVVSPTGSWLATTGEDANLHLWDLRSGAEVASANHDKNSELLRRDGETLDVTFAPDELRLAVHVDYGRIRIYSIPNLELQDEIGVDANPIRAIAFTPQGIRMAINTRKGRLAILDFDDADRRREVAASNARPVVR